MTKNHLPTKALEISGIAGSTDDGIQVIDKTTGKRMWLPRREIDFRPGHVILPAWLWRKINGYHHKSKDRLVPDR